MNANRTEVSSVLSLIDRQGTIQARAYELYQLRGCENGYELEDWLQAERELDHRQIRTAAA
jgi:Protein of unknown function (DUF2934)